MNDYKKLSPWIALTGEFEKHCCTRVIEGTDPNIIKNRIAFIEKTPRIRIVAGDYSFDRGENFDLPIPKKEMDIWVSGRKGAGGSGDAEKEQLYGFYPPSREWCDKLLTLLGYTLG